MATKPSQEKQIVGGPNLQKQKTQASN